MILNEQEKLNFLVALFSQSDLPARVVAARVVYEDHRTAEAALKLAIQNADSHQKRWKQCREGIIVIRFEK